MQSIDTARRIKDLSKELGVKLLLIVGNKMKHNSEHVFLKKVSAELGIPLLATIPYDESIEQADMARVAPIDFAPDSPVVSAIESLKNSLIMKFPST
jgi:CO dehydrogenase nickel-insertion accessory protein CooC1